MPPAQYRELVDKLAWSIGSTFHTPYGRRSGTWGWAVHAATLIADRVAKGKSPVPEYHKALRISED